jgi:hypothetical protein
MAGNWKSLAVARTYIEESEITMMKQANLTLKDKNTKKSSLISLFLIVNFINCMFFRQVFMGKTE